MKRQRRKCQTNPESKLLPGNVPEVSHTLYTDIQPPSLQMGQIYIAPRRGAEALLLHCQRQAAQHHQVKNKPCHSYLLPTWSSPEG